MRQCDQQLPTKLEKLFDRLLRGDSHPVLAIASFFAAFLLAAIPFLIGTDQFFVVVACLIACFSSVILFLRLLVGNLGPIKFILLATAALLALYAGSQWYIPLTLAGGTVVCSYISGRLIGDFSPLIRGVKL